MILALLAMILPILSFPFLKGSLETRSSLETKLFVSSTTISIVNVVNLRLNNKDKPMSHQNIYISFWLFLGQHFFFFFVQ